MNQLVLSACIAEASALRYTPAGLPALDFRLEHESQIEEAGQQRQVKVAVKAVAFGSLAEGRIKTADEVGHTLIAVGAKRPSQ